MLQALGLSLTEKIRVSPTQTRIVPIRITQSEPFFGGHIQFRLSLTSESAGVTTLVLRIPVKHVPQLLDYKNKAIVSSYFYSAADPTPFLAIPPSNVGEESSNLTLPVLALRLCFFSATCVVICLLN